MDKDSAMILLFKSENLFMLDNSFLTKEGHRTIKY
uniref:Uncharacterized protein n=1 Tax=viral metagenome TaxID=1070528 RepID=A0A6C0CCL4_9ZZZZ